MHMSKYELLSLIVAGLSLFVATWAIAVSKHTAKSQAVMTGRNLLATNHTKYSNLLFEVQTATQDAKERLTDTARDIHDQLCHLFDQYGTRDGVRPVRHLYDEVIQWTFDSFRGELARQPVLNLGRRFASFRYVEDSIDELRLTKRKLQAKARWERLALRRTYQKNRNGHFEHVVLKSATFNLLVVDLCDRVRSESRSDLFRPAIIAISRYTDLHREHRAIFEENIAKLEAGLRQNELEEFALSESSPLFQKYRLELSKLETIEHFSLDDSQIFLESKFPTPTPIGELIYFGGLLYAISMEWAWGD